MPLFMALLLMRRPGELVGMDVQDGGELKVVELGFANRRLKAGKL